MGKNFKRTTTFLLCITKVNGEDDKKASETYERINRDKTYGKGNR